MDFQNILIEKHYKENLTRTISKTKCLRKVFSVNSDTHHLNHKDTFCNIIREMNSTKIIHINFTTDTTYKTKTKKQEQNKNYLPSQTLNTQTRF